MARLRRTIGYHIVKSGYGLWLPGDDRGYWSEAWDDQIGFYEPHMLHQADPIRLRMAEERMKYPPVKLSPEMVQIVVDQIGECARKSPWINVAASIESTHTHPLLTYSGLDIHNTCKWIADQTTKAGHRRTSYQGPIWGKGKWCSFIFHERHWRNAAAYIARHNIRRGLEAHPYDFVEPIDAR
jgi:hypothetical protein